MNASDIGINGTYIVYAFVYGINELTDEARDVADPITIILDNCKQLGTATLDNKIVNDTCEGTITATPEKVL